MEPDLFERENRSWGLRFLAVVQFGEEASQTRDYASQGTRRFARLAQILRCKERLLQDDNQTAPLPYSPARNDFL